jgi:hypothetical protein
LPSPNEEDPSKNQSSLIRKKKKKKEKKFPYLNYSSEKFMYCTVPYQNSEEFPKIVVAFSIFFLFFLLFLKIWRDNNVIKYIKR